MCDTTPIEGDRGLELLFKIGDAKSDRCDPTSKHANFSGRHGLPSVQPGSSNGVQPNTQSSKTVLAASHSPDQPVFELMNPLSGQTKGNANSDDIVVVEDPGSTWDLDRDSLVGVSEDEGMQDEDESDSASHSWESITNSCPESAVGHDSLTCSDTEEAAVKSACKRFCKKVWALCSPSKQGIWKDTQLEQIRNNHNTVWGSNYEAIKTEWDLTLDRDPSSFEVQEMMVCTNQLLQIKVATNVRNIFT